MANALVPEFAVTDWRRSRRFYCDILGFTCEYERPEDGFCFLSRDGAELMIDQIGTGRSFDDGHFPDGYPFGKGLNVQIEVFSIEPLLAGLAAARYRCSCRPRIGGIAWVTPKRETGNSWSPIPMGICCDFFRIWASVR